MGVYSGHGCPFFMPRPLLKIENFAIYYYLGWKSTTTMTDNKSDQTIVASSERFRRDVRAKGGILETTIKSSTTASGKFTETVLLKYIVDEKVYVKSYDLTKLICRPTNLAPMDQSTWLLHDPWVTMQAPNCDCCVLIYCGPEKNYADPLICCLPLQGSDRDTLNAKITELTAENAKLKSFVVEKDATIRTLTRLGSGTDDGN